MPQSSSTSPSLVSVFARAKAASSTVLQTIVAEIPSLARRLAATFSIVAGYEGLSKTVGTMVPAIARADVSHPTLLFTAEYSLVLLGMHCLSRMSYRNFITPHAIDYIAKRDGIARAHVTAAQLSTLTDQESATIKADLEQRGIQLPAFYTLCEDIATAWGRDYIKTILFTLVPYIAIASMTTDPTLPLYAWSIGAMAAMIASAIKTENIKRQTAKTPAIGPAVRS